MTAVLLAGAVFARLDDDKAEVDPALTSTPSVSPVAPRDVQALHRQPRSARPGLPVSLSVPALGLASVPVDQAAWVPEVVGRKNQESLDIPDDIDRVGWDVSSARLGERHGVALISGHRDAADGGHGALEHVEDLVPGARVVVTTAAGDRLTYTVTGVEAIPNDSLPDRLFATRGPHRLALVTCGGRLVKGNDGRLHWNSNVIAWAAPA